MKIHAIDYQSFNNAMSERNINDETIKAWKNQAFIEIQSERDLDSCPFWFKENHPNVLRITFDDTEKDYLDKDYWVRVITDEKAKEIFDFVIQNKGKHFLIHCHAGVSRSGAVAQFICELNDISLQEFQTMNPYTLPSFEVLSKLRKIKNQSPC